MSIDTVDELKNIVEGFVGFVADNKNLDENEKPQNKLVSFLNQKPGRWAEDDIIHSGSIQIDLAVGIGGLPRGKVIEIYGAESCGKSTVAQLIMSNAQKKGLLGVYIDSEYALDPNYASALGVDTDSMLVVRPEYLEQGIDTIIGLCNNGFDGFIVLDSIPNLLPKRMMELSAEDEGRRAAMAAVYTRMMPVVKKAISDSNATLFMINQTRSTMATQPWEKKEDTPGGKMLKYTYDLRLQVSRSMDSDEKRSGDGLTYNEINVQCIKNKFGAPFKKGSFIVRPDIGIDPFEDVINAALRPSIAAISEDWKFDGNEILNKKGWFSFPISKETYESFMEQYPEAEIVDEFYIADDEGVISETPTYVIQAYRMKKFYSLIEDYSGFFTPILFEAVLNTLNDSESDFYKDGDSEDDIRNFIIEEEDE